MSESQEKHEPVAVFVYGSLKEGHRLHGWLQGCEKLHDEAYLDDHGLISFGAYPAMIYMPVTYDDICVMGQVYLLPFHRFHQLRVMEERVGYKTKDVNVRIPDDRDVDCKAFVFAEIHSGIHSWELDDTGHALVQIV